MSIRSFMLRLLLPRRRDPAPYVPPPTPKCRDIRPMVKQAIANVTHERLVGIQLHWTRGVVPSMAEGCAAMIFYSLCHLYTQTDLTRDEIDAAIMEMMEHLG